MPETKTVIDPALLWGEVEESVRDRAIKLFQDSPHLLRQNRIFVSSVTSEQVAQNLAMLAAHLKSCGFKVENSLRERDMVARDASVYTDLRKKISDSHFLVALVGGEAGCPCKSCPPHQLTIETRNESGRGMTTFVANSVTQWEFVTAWRLNSATGSPQILPFRTTPWEAEAEQRQERFVNLVTSLSAPVSARASGTFLVPLGAPGKDGKPAGTGHAGDESLATRIVRSILDALETSDRRLSASLPEELVQAWTSFHHRAVFPNRRRIFLVGDQGSEAQKSDRIALEEFFGAYGYEIMNPATARSDRVDLDFFPAEPELVSIRQAFSAFLDAARPLSVHVEENWKLLQDVEEWLGDFQESSGNVIGSVRELLVQLPLQKIAEDNRCNELATAQQNAEEGARREGPDLLIAERVSTEIQNRSRVSELITQVEEGFRGVEGRLAEIEELDVAAIVRKTLGIEEARERIREAIRKLGALLLPLEDDSPDQDEADRHRDLEGLRNACRNLEKELRALQERGFEEFTADLKRSRAHFNAQVGRPAEENPAQREEADLHNEVVEQLRQLHEGIEFRRSVGTFFELEGELERTREAIEMVREGRERYLEVLEPLRAAVQGGNCQLREFPPSLDEFFGSNGNGTAGRDGDSEASRSGVSRKEKDGQGVAKVGAAVAKLLKMLGGADRAGRHPLSDSDLAEVKRYLETCVSQGSELAENYAAARETQRFCVARHNLLSATGLEMEKYIRPVLQGAASVGRRLVLLERIRCKVNYFFFIQSDPSRGGTKPTAERDQAGNDGTWEGMLRRCFAYSRKEGENTEHTRSLLIDAARYWEEHREEKRPFSMIWLRPKHQLVRDIDPVADGPQDGGDRGPPKVYYVMDRNRNQQIVQALLDHQRCNLRTEEEGLLKETRMYQQEHVAVLEDQVGSAEASFVNTEIFGRTIGSTTTARGLMTAGGFCLFASTVASVLLMGSPIDGWERVVLAIALSLLWTLGIVLLFFGVKPYLPWLQKEPEHESNDE